MKLSITTKKHELMILFRPIQWAFCKNWYSLYRWRNIANYPFSTDTVRLIDIGMVSIGYGTFNDKTRLKN